MSEFIGGMMGSLAQLLGMAEGASGGLLPTILAQLENAGLGEPVRSWIGHGDNLPVTPDALRAAFSQHDLETWAKQANTTPEALLEVLAEALPHAVDKATPDGKLP